MPYKDKTGPEGRGPRTGRSLGSCAPSNDLPKDSGLRGRGSGRGRGLGLRRFVNRQDEARQERSR